MSCDLRWSPMIMNCAKREGWTSQALRNISADLFRLNLSSFCKPFVTSIRCTTFLYKLLGYRVRLSGVNISSMFDSCFTESISSWAVSQQRCTTDVHKIEESLDDGIPWKVPWMLHRQQSKFRSHRGHLRLPPQLLLCLGYPTRLMEWWLDDLLLIFLWL